MLLILGALFEIPPYRGSITQNIYYANSDLCNYNMETRAGFPVRSPFAPPQDEEG